MGIKAILAKPFARFVSRKVRKESAQALYWQNYWMNKILVQAAQTAYGIDHKFESIKSYLDFKKAIPVSDYEGLRSYIDRVVKGEKDVLWPGLPVYFAKTSGTTSGVKYIPISKESIGFHINSARNALLFYIEETGNADFVDGKLIFLSGSPVLDTKNGIFTGRLSGIVNHHVPQYL
ncbi:MAG: GH3 auxin-responsive promoter family protein, partial [Bacteroidia bacterium]|nr:GH3 auxin-responsive promoter family protein [Bacteroidia bacterium]